MFATRMDKIILTQVMCREINKGYETFVSFTFFGIKSYLISSRNVNFRRIKSKNSKRFPTVCFLAAYALKKKSIQQPINNFEI